MVGGGSGWVCGEGDVFVEIYSVSCINQVFVGVWVEQVGLNKGKKEKEWVEGSDVAR